jgi:hypothetical protein
MGGVKPAIVWKGLTFKQLSAQYGVPIETIRGRYQSGIRGPDLIVKDVRNNANYRHWKKVDNPVMAHPLYQTWASMIKRCYNPRSNRYVSYGGRGIMVCDSWLDFWNFAESMGDRPDGLTLDRKDNNLDYTPENCRWATKEQQANNKRNTVIVLYKGERMSMVNAWRASGEIVNLATYSDRIRRGMSADEALK